ncbi:MAG: HEAT repeat domain-containing protein [Myxococcota bacterium]
MGLLDFLKPKSALQKATEQIREAYAQPEYRRTAMDKLFEMGTDEAYAALLQRFTYNANGQIADESEKNDLVKELSDVGEKVLPALKTFIRSEQQLAYPIRALVKIMGREDARAFLIETLERYDPADHRTTKPKNSLMIALADLCEPEQASSLVPYLSDQSDDVQAQTVMALERLANPETKDALCAVCADDVHAARVQRQAAGALVELGWSVKDRYAGFVEELREEFMVGKKGALIRKPTA